MVAPREIALAVPGNGARSLRRMPLLETHPADLSFLFGIDQGQAGSPLLPEPLEGRRERSCLQGP